MIFKIRHEDDLAEFLDDRRGVYDNNFCIFNLKEDDTRHFIQEMWNLVDYVRILNQKYPAFPLFYVEVDDQSTEIRADKKSPRDYLRVTLKFNTTPILSYQMEKMKNDWIVYQTLCTFDQKPNVLDYIYHTKYLPDNTDIWTIYEYHIFESDESLDPRKVDTDFKPYENFMAKLTDESLLPLMLLSFNPFDDEKLLVTQNQYSSAKYINTYHNNVFNQVLQIKHKQLQSGLKSYFAVPGFINYETSSALSFYSDYELNNDLDDKQYWYWPSSVWFDHIHQFANFIYDKKLTNATITNKYYEDGINTLNKFKAQTQTLDLSTGLKHNNDIDTWHRNNNPNTLASIEATYFYNLVARYDENDKSDNDNSPLFLYTYTSNHLLMPNQSIFYRTLTFNNEVTNTSTLITLNPYEQVKFLQAVYNNINFQSQSTHYNEQVANSNITFFKQIFLVNLGKLPELFPHKTLKVQTNLTFKPDVNSINFDRSQAFLTFNPRVNAYLNHYSFYHLSSDYLEDPIGLTNLLFLAQDMNYPALTFRSSFAQFPYALWNQTPNDKKISVVGTFFFLGYLHLFFTKYVFYSKKFGYILHTMNFNNLLHGDLVFNTTNKKIDDATLSAGYKFYDQLLTKIYDTFLSKEFLNAWCTLVNDDTSHNLDEKTHKGLFDGVLKNNWVNPLTSDMNFINYEYNWKQECVKMWTTNEYYEMMCVYLEQFERYIRSLIGTNADKITDNKYFDLIKETITKLAQELNLEIKPYNDYADDLIKQERTYLIPNIELDKDRQAPSKTSYSNYKKGRL